MQNNIPKIRFKKYNSALLKHKISELATITNGHLDSNVACEYGKYNFYTCGQKILKINTSNFVGPAIIIAGSGSIGTIYKDDGKFNACQRNFVLQNFLENRDFLYYSISKNLLPKVKLEVGIGAIPNILYPMIANLQIYIPSKDEQSDISNLLNNLSALINSTWNKYLKLKQVKYSLINRIFSQDLNTEPGIKFINFSNKWKTIKFSEICQIRRGLTYSPENLTDFRGKRVLRSSNIQDEEFSIFDDDVYVHSSAVNIPYVKNGNILITSACGSPKLVGKHAIINGVDDNAVVHGGFMLLLESEFYKFVNASMNSAWYKNFLQTYVSGGNGAIGNLNKNDLENYKILIPNDKNEIDKIGNFFYEIDKLISLTNQKYQKLLKIKQTLIKKLIV